MSGATVSNRYSMLDVFLILAFNASFFQSRKTLRKMGFDLLTADRCDEEAKDVIRNLIINVQDPLKSVSDALQRWSGKPEYAAEYNRRVAEGTIVPKPLC